MSIFNFKKKRRHADKLQALRKKYDAELDVIRCRIDMDESLLDSFLVDKKTAAYQEAFQDNAPLVTVCIATYNRGKLLTERTIPSVLEQTYKNIELIVVGDCCQDDTPERLSKISDPRLKFINLGERGKYPDDPMMRWMVAGTKPMNHALSMAKGAFITHLDDDDRYPLDRIEKLVAFAQEKRIDIIWHPFHWETEPDKWIVNECPDFVYSKVTTSSVFYHHWFRRIPWDINAYRLKEPGDWNRFRKFKYLNAKMERYPESLLYHYMERSQKNA